MFNLAEYLWIDGAEPTREIRSKARVIEVESGKTPKLSDFPEWSFDGSSTNQAAGHDSDCMLKPVNFVKDPIRGGNNYLVLCEVLSPNGDPHPTNTRAKLREVLDKGGKKQDPWIGFEQEYTMFKGALPLSWPPAGFPPPQGPYYCGVGADKVTGRELVERHTQACLDAGIMIYGINAEVMLAQWEFQIGYRGSKNESADVLNVSDHLVFARWLMCRLGEEHGITISFAPKPIKGDWNGAGNHANFSTNDLRDPRKGKKAIADAVKTLEKNHKEHVLNYGFGLADRLTGLHETCHIDEFRYGDADRGASIRIPAHVAQKGYGYIEDRRPAANCDPYLVSALLVNTVCGIGVNLTEEKVLVGV